MVTEQRITDIIKALNAYDATHTADGTDPATGNYRAWRVSNIWQDIITGLPEYDEDGPKHVHRDRSDMFALTDGSVIQYDQAGSTWFCSQRGNG